MKWKELFEADLRGMSLARRLFASLSDETLNHVFEALATSTEEIEQLGDIDFQGRIISQILSKKDLVKLLPRVAVDSIRSIFS